MVCVCVCVTVETLTLMNRIFFFYPSPKTYIIINNNKKYSIFNNLFLFYVFYKFSIKNRFLYKTFFFFCTYFKFSSTWWWRWRQRVRCMKRRTLAMGGGGGKQKNKQKQDTHLGGIVQDDKRWRMGFFFSGSDKHVASDHRWSWKHMTLIRECSSDKGGVRIYNYSLSAPTAAQRLQPTSIRFVPLKVSLLNVLHEKLSKSKLLRRWNHCL